MFLFRMVAEPPIVRDAYAKNSDSAGKLPVPTRTVEEGEQVYLVEAHASVAIRVGLESRWKVRLDNFFKGDYLNTCTCGMTASRLAVCNHTLRAAKSSFAEITDFRKPWQARIVRQKTLHASDP